MGGSKFTGGVLGYLGMSVLCVLIIFCSLGIAVQWAFCLMENWKVEHTKIDGKQIVFDGRGSELFIDYLFWMLLTLITCGIYALWIPIKLERYKASRTYFIDTYL